MTPAGDPLRDLVHAALLAPSPLERYRPGRTRRLTYGAISMVSDGDAGPDFNRVLVLGQTDPDQIFALADPFFGDPFAYSVLIELGTAEAVEDDLQARGWRLDEEEPALVLAPLPAAPPPAPPELAIRPVLDAAGFDDFLGVSETPSVFLPSLAAALDPAVALRVGYLDGRAVATARLTRLGTIAEIHGVVVPWARRRGYGTALTWAAIAAARDRGCESAVLTASALGYPVYRRMGFRQVGVYRTYLPPEPAAHRTGNGQSHEVAHR